MVVNWPEIVVQTALIVLLFLLVALYAKLVVVPKLKHHAGEWAGAAIGRFWQKLMEDAEKDNQETGSGGGGGSFKIAGMEITPALLKQGMELLQWAQQMGWIKSSGGGGGENPFLKQ